MANLTENNDHFYGYKRAPKNTKGNPGGNIDMEFESINPYEFNKNSFFSQVRTNSISGSCLCFNNSKKLKRILTTDFGKLEHDYQLGIIFSLIGIIFDNLSSFNPDKILKSLSKDIFPLYFVLAFIIPLHSMNGLFIK